MAWFEPYAVRKVWVRFTRIVKQAVAPTRSTEGAAGWDLTCVEAEMDEDGNRICYTGIAVEIPPGYVGLLFPRSGIYKKGLQLANSVGVIDSDYRGEIRMVFNSTHTGTDETYFAGERCGQLLIMPIPQVHFTEVKQLSKTARGQGGFGSTGN